MSREVLGADRLLTSHQVGQLLQVNPSSVKNWVDEGRLASFRTPGGHRRIRVADLLDFLSRHEMPVPARLAAASRRRLLIVDDDEVHLRTLSRRLKPYHDTVEVQLSDNGIDALVSVGSFKPDLVVLDVFMPEIDGIEVCRRLKLNAQTRHIGVVVTSAHLTPAIENNALEAGALVCLPKPIELKVLLLHLAPQQALGG